MVSSGDWKDYGLSISKREISFNVYHRTAEFPIYKITKNLKPNFKYFFKPILRKDRAIATNTSSRGVACGTPKFQTITPTNQIR